MFYCADHNQSHLTDCVKSQMCSLFELIGFIANYNVEHNVACCGPFMIDRYSWYVLTSTAETNSNFINGQLNEAIGDHVIFVFV